MAYTIRGSSEPKFVSTAIEFLDDEARLDAFFSTTRAFPGTIRKATWHTGADIPAEVVPKRARIIKGKRIYDWLDLRGGATMVSARFKDAVEELDSGRHQFFPLAVEDREGAMRPEQYFVFNIVGRLNSIIEDRSNFSVVGHRENAAWTYQRKIGPWECALDASVIGGRACWVEHHYDGVWFISDTLAELLKARQLSGFRLDEHSTEIVV